MTFNEAVEKMKAGKRVSRKKWNGSRYVELAKNVKYKNPYGKTVKIKSNINGGGLIMSLVCKTGIQIGWLASPEEWTANDWFVVGSPRKL